jgi:hypothetical protein
MTPGHGERLSRKEQAFLAALLVHPTIIQAAKTVGIAEATATRWMKEPAFKTAYAEARQQALGETLAFLQQSMLAAVATLRQVMLAADTTAPAKIMAARALLEYGLRAVTLEQMEERMQAIEAALKEGGR